MVNLKTKFIGLELKSPIIAGSCGLTSEVSKIEEIALSGAGAIVLKSIFEEQINMDASKALTDNSYPESADYIQNYIRANTVQQHIDLVKAVKNKVNIPVIASINCLRDGEWISFASELEKAGADALELNAFILPMDEFAESVEVENMYFDIVKHVKKVVKIPVIVKISQPADLRTTLRWTGILSGKDKLLQLSSSTGVHNGEAVVKLLLAGATTVQVCSAMYEQGIGTIRTMNHFLNSWMDKKGFESIDEFRGRLSYADAGNAARYERAQFMKYFSDHK